MLYKKNTAKELSEELFRNPTSEYRGTPFWSWNCRLDKDELLWQIEVLKKMGFGGFHMHVRQGMATPYLGEEFMDLVAACVKKAKKEEMLAWLYDEDRWPSGYAGGFVTKDPEYRIKYLLFTPTPYEVEGGRERQGNEQATAVRSGQGRLVAVFDIVLDEEGCLKSYRRIKEGEAAEGRLWYAYIETPHCSPRYNGYTYADTLKKAAIDRFIELTHEAYRQKVGSEFGSTVPAIFTDEPQFTHKQTLRFADSLQDVALPWTDNLPDTYAAVYGEELVANIPELIWELPDGRVSKTRYRYHDHVCERFTEAFADNIGGWCEKNNILLTGHMMKEPTLFSQTSAVSEAMRAYRSFHIPGIDMLANRHEYTTAKQAQSAARQFGREGVMSELYGVTSWDYDFRGHKLQGDWQAALGVTVRVPHLSWVSMEGEAKRDYPASISYQSPWYSLYSYIENHFSRLNTALTRGKPCVRVGVIHPIESYWLHWGPAEQTALVRDQLDTEFQSLTEWLLFGSIDFDYIAESLLPDLCKKGGCPLEVGYMKYDVVIVPGCRTLRSTTLERLAAFAAAGGRLIFMGDAPKYVDASDEAAGPAIALYNDSKAERISYSRSALLAALELYRIIDIRNTSGSLTDNLVHQLRYDGDGMWLFVCPGKDPVNPDISRRQDVKITIKGLWTPTLYDTLTGEIRPQACSHAAGNTVISAGLYQHDSLLLRLMPAAAAAARPEPPKAKPEVRALDVPPAVPYTTGEPNVLLLDMAHYALDDEEYSALPEEILRADTACRRRLGWTPWSGGADQPWYLPADPPEHKIRLRFSILSDIDYPAPLLALETPEVAKIIFNGQPTDNTPSGWYIDKSIKTLRLPPIRQGNNTLEIEYPFGKRTATEPCYLLGNFGVEVRGRIAKIVEPAKTLAYESITNQTLPFYSGVLTYHFEPETRGGELEITIPQYRGAVLTASVDEGEPVVIAFSPYKANFGVLPAGRHKLDVNLYVPRTNTCGPLHCADDLLSYPGPGAWRTLGDRWCYEYRLKREGITVSPRIYEITYPNN